MYYEVKPVSNFKCSINVPGSKSFSNRALIIGALAEGKTVLKNMLFSDDTWHMINSFKGLGIPLNVNEKEHIVELEGYNNERYLQGQCFVGNAGTVMRFLPSFIAVQKGDVEITGIERMKNRPIGELVNILNRLGANISYLEKEGYPPIRIKANGLNGGNLSIRGDVSSQFISSILLSAPYAQSDIDLEIVGEVVSKPYIDMTIEIMQDFGVVVENEEYKRFYVKAGQRYKGREYTIESDCSSASYFFGAAGIAQGDVTINHINPYSLQGDIRFVDILEKMGAKVERGENYIRVIGDKLKGISVDMSDMPDLVQTLAVVALFAEGTTEIKNVCNLRIKETDRLRALYNELTKLGARVEEKKDGLVIHPQKFYKPSEIETYNDHRMVMSFTLAGLRIPGIRIKNPECVSKSFPNFFKEFEKIYEEV